MSKLPTYPIMIVTEEYAHGCFGSTCCCGNKFSVDPCDGENLVSNNHTLYECCPECFGMPGMSREEHTVYLKCIKQMLERMRETFLTMGKSSAGWYYVHYARVLELFNHANGGEQLVLATDNPHQAILEHAMLVSGWRPRVKKNPAGMVGDNLETAREDSAPNRND